MTAPEGAPGPRGRGWRRRLALATVAAAGTALVGSSIVIATVVAPKPSGHPETAMGGVEEAPPPSPPSRAWVRRSIRGSPPRLARLHRHGGALLGEGVADQLRALRGYPVVLNAWASWCAPCRDELPMMARESARFGTRVAFVGADVDDSAHSARALLAGERLSYPSLRATAPEVRALTPIVGFPTTVFLDRRGRVEFTHQGQYPSASELAADVRRYALGGGAG